MKLILRFLIALMPLSGLSQSTRSFRKEVKTFRLERNEQFKNKTISPLEKADLLKFSKLRYFRPKRRYRIKAKLVRTPDSDPFEMETTTKSRPIYEKFGDLIFDFKGNTYTLKVYQSQNSRRNPLQRNQLFLPFCDQTNGQRSYSGGRYIELQIPAGEEIIVDFNRAFNPFCVYNPKYSCPIVPKVNHLEITISAGEKKYK